MMFWVIVWAVAVIIVIVFVGEVLLTGIFEGRNIFQPRRKPTSKTARLKGRFRRP